MDIPVATRPVQPDDGPLLCRLWDRLSAETVYRRIHAPLRSPPADAHRFVEVDHDLREALVAVVGDEVVGVARYDRPVDDPSTAEIAVLVEDDWQGMGLGRQLLGELTTLAGRRGVRTVTATVQPDNAPVLSLVRRLLPGSTVALDDDVLAVTSPLPVTSEPVSGSSRPDSVLPTAPH